MGFPEEMIVNAINHSPDAYDTSVDGLIARKKAGVSNNVMAAMVRKADPEPQPKPATSSPLPASPPASFVPAATQTPLPHLTAPPPLPTGVPTPTSASVAVPSPSPVYAPPAGPKPRVFLESKSRGELWTATRDQSMEMSKDFEQLCPDVRISVNHQMADYTVSLNHIEHGFGRDNQVQVANKEGDLISRTKEGGSIKSRVKKACDDILVDWASVKR
jgi:hypothetical protein